MSSAIVTGATGILGREIVFALGRDPATWKSVHALSRSQKETYPSNVKHDAVDLTGDAQKLAAQIKGVEAEYVFFAAYLQKDDEQAMWDVNTAMIRNFIDALQLTGAIRSVKRILLVTGAKQYGLHLGRPKNPMVESDPRIDGPGRPPNFYYGQQDVLKEKSAQAGWDWVVTYPNDVIGAVKNNFMNLCTALALCAVVCKELDGRMPWPGSERFYSAATSFTSAKLHADFCLWAAREPKCSNQGFNVVNGDTESYQNLWPKIAAYFGCTVPADQFAHPPDPALGSRAQLADRPPIAEHAEVLGLEGSAALEPSYLESRIDVTRWSQRPEVKAAWEQAAAREGLDKEAFEKATWGFLVFQLGRPFDLLISMSKARAYGWTGYRDTWESMVEVFEELAAAKILPKGKAA